MDTVKWGILSTADINRRVLPGATSSPQVELVAVGSRDQGKADAFAKQWEIPRAYGSYEALLEDPEIEAVYIPLPNTLHVEWSIKALEAGKHVLCEKPFDRSPENVARAFDASERTGMLLTEAFMYRHSPQTKKLEELVAGGAIGELRLIRSCFSYCVSGSRLLAGEPDRVQAQAWYGPTGTDWVFTGVLHFPNDVLATFDCGTALPNRDELEAIGSEGSLFVDDPWHCRKPGIELRRDDSVERIEVDFEDPYKLEFENLGNAIRGKAELLLGRDDAIAQATTIQALHDDARRG
jgi:predicted dehydrogenase